jgi:uncharacterized protein (TIGR02246 family)
MDFDKQIEELEKKFWQTMIDKDVDAALKLTADPCLVTGAQGASRIDAKSFAKMMEGGKWTLHGFTFSDVKVEKLGDDAAIIVYKVKEDITVDGKRMNMEAADASTWVKQDGAWRCALHTESVLGDPFGRDRKPVEKAA